MLTEREYVNQAYSWYTFWISAMRSGVLPLWDPYAFAGHPFAGEMQTGAFYPINFLLLLFPFGKTGTLSELLYHAMIALARFGGAYFMYLLAREFQLREFAAILTGVCFTFGGVVARVSGWPHLLQSGIWLPLIFLFLLRALRARASRGILYNAALGGLFMGLSALAGGLHFLIMQEVVVISAGAYYAWSGDRAARIRAVLAVGISAATGAAIGAIQLFPSYEYSAISLRWLGPVALPSNQKIPYAYFTDKLYPQGILQLLLPMGFNGHGGDGEVLNAYFGVLPLLLAAIGVWSYWPDKWVRYLAGLALAGYLYSLGDASLLHGFAYVLVPDLWMAREAPRFLYLTDFALVLFTGFGVQALFGDEFPVLRRERLTRSLNWIAIACGLALVIPALFGKPDLNTWNSFSIVLILGTVAITRFVIAGHRGRAAQAVVLAIVLFDLYAWDWGPRNKITQAEGDEMEHLRASRGVANFLRAQTGSFRVELVSDIRPNIGDSYAIETTTGGAVTLLKDYVRFTARKDLLNVRYTLRPASAKDPGEIYSDAMWKVYVNPGAFPRVWIVHQTETRNSVEDLAKRLDAPDFDAHRTALTYSALTSPLDPPVDNAGEEANVRAFAPGRIDVRTRSTGKGLLVLSEIFAPGWKATVNGNAAKIWQVDGMLRAIVIPPGEARVALTYAPASVYSGAAVTAAGLAFVLYALVALRPRRFISKRSTSQSSLAADSAPGL